MSQEQMRNRLYVGNLSYNTTEQGLRSEFAKCGTVTEAKVVMDRETGRSRGFGFVQFATEAEASTAITELDGITFDGRQLAVRIAEDRPQRSGGGARLNNSGGGGGQGRSNNPPQGGGGYDQGGGGGRGGGRDRKRRRDRDDSDWS